MGEGVLGEDVGVGSCSDEAASVLHELFEALGASF